MRFSEPADLPALKARCAEPEILRSIDVVREAALPTAESDRAASFALVADDADDADDGCIVAECLFPGRFMLHTNLLRQGFSPAGRARWEATIGKIFVSRTGVDFLFVAVPRAARSETRALKRSGFAFSFDLACVAGSTLPPFSVYQLSLHDWIARGTCTPTGKRIVARIRQELGRQEEADDPMRMAFLGAAAEMIAVQNITKAVETFNAWARIAGRTPMRLLSTDPVRVDVGACVIRVDAQDVHVERVFHA